MKKKIFLSEKEFLQVVKKLVEQSSTEDEDIALAVSNKNPNLGLAMSDMSEEIGESDDYKDRSMYDPYYGDEDSEDNYDPRTDLIETLKSKIESGEEFDESDMEEINSSGKPYRRGRGSIYVEVFVPETDDKEFDRQVAIKMMEYYSKKVKDENYVGGVGFKNRDILNPYDKDF